MTSRNQKFYFSDHWSEVQRNAPFGTYYTPDIETRIIGSKYRNYQIAPIAASTPNTARSNGTTTVEEIINKKPILPPIYTEPNYEIELRALIDNNLPTNQYSNELSVKPLNLRPVEQNSLLKLTEREILDVPEFLTRLKKVYLILAHLDINLTGLSTFKELVDAFYNCDIHISLDLLRLICSLYVVPSRDTVAYVNYEKVISFLGAVFKNLQEMQRNQSRSVMTEAGNQTIFATKEGPLYYHDAACDDVPVQNENNHDSKERNLVNQRSALLEKLSSEIGVRPIPIQLIRMSCQRADSLHRGTLSAHQIYEICTNDAINLRLSDDSFNRLIHHCKYMGGGQINWEDFINFLEKIQPITTGLNIPSSRMPLDYIKPIPNPINSWPHSEEPQLHHKAERTNREVQTTKDLNNKKEFGQQFTDRSSANEIDKIREINNTSNLLSSLSQNSPISKPVSELQEASKQFSEPWFNRFLKFCDAIYLKDNQNRGVLPTGQLYETTILLNHQLQLQLATSDIVKAIDSAFVDNDRLMVNINSFLRKIAVHQ